MTKCRGAQLRALAFRAVVHGEAVVAAALITALDFYAIRGGRARSQLIGEFSAGALQRSQFQKIENMLSDFKWLASNSWVLGLNMLGVWHCVLGAWHVMLGVWRSVLGV